MAGRGAALGIGLGRCGAGGQEAAPATVEATEAVEQAKELVVPGRSRHAGEDATAMVMAEEEDDRNEKREERWMAHLSLRERERRW